METNTAEQTQAENVSQLPVVQRQRTILEVRDPVPILDTGRFEHMQRIAAVMAKSNLIPEALTTFKNGSNLENLPEHAIIANCFLVVNQAVRWNMDPFAVAQSVSVVKGKLCYEGKLIAAVLERQLGIRLRYEWDDKPGEQLGIRVSGTFPDGTTETISGTVSDWKTSHAGSPWTPKQFRKMLAYRGTREWARLYAPGTMLGVYSDDELEDIADEARGRRAIDVSTVERTEPAKRLGPPPAASVPSSVDGKLEEQKATTSNAAEPDADGDTIDPETGEVVKTVVWSDDAPPVGDEEGIPGFLQRGEATITAEEDVWLKELARAFGGAGDMHELFEAQADHMRDRKGKVSAEAWRRAQALAEDAISKVQEKAKK